jgi:hypothetical protein
MQRLELSNVLLASAASHAGQAVAEMKEEMNDEMVASD